MASYFRSTLASYLARTDSEIFSQLNLAYASDGFAEMRTDLTLTWWDDLLSLREVLRTLCATKSEAAHWHVLLEFTIPRKQRRIDIVLLADGHIVLIECKSGTITSEALRQIEDYALLLHYFHKPSDRRKLRPIVVTRKEVDSASARKLAAGLGQEELGFHALPSFWISRTQICSWSGLAELLSEPFGSFAPGIDGEDWNDGAYRPTPTVIEAALALRTGLSIREIAMSEAAEHDVEEVIRAIREIVEQAKGNGQHAICFLTGVPGSGKTLVGLSLAHLSESRADAIHFMSGNGPLVAVLQEVFRRQAMRDGVPANQALIHAQTLIENVHVFAKNYTEKDPNRAPSNRVIIFDEAQRAWNLTQNLNKFKRNYSEPEMLLRIMQRHEDWSCVIALVGGGQEINSGEAGLEEWGQAIAESEINWTVYASPEVIKGGISTAGHRLFGPTTKASAVNTSDLLHLKTSNRSLRADKLAGWVNLVLDGKQAAAVAMNLGDRFPLLLSRDLTLVRRKLREQSLGDSRYGLVGSSGAARLRAEGLEPNSTFHADYPWHHWYLAPREDIRSSYQCEVFATEFEIQGLELDWVGVCWGGDFVWSGTEWMPRDLRPGAVTRWRSLTRVEKRQFRLNAYRVLLTRARQGMILFIPRGDSEDPTRDPAEFDDTATFLLGCGVREMP